MTATSNAPNDWNDCPPGEIGGLVESLQSRRRRKTLRQAAGVSTALVLFALLVTSWFSGWFAGPQPLHAISCKKVHSLAPQFVSGRLDADLSAEIQEHLEECKMCREYLHAEFPQFPLPVHAADTWNAAAAPWAATVIGSVQNC